MLTCALCGSETIENVDTAIRNRSSIETAVHKCLTCGVQFLFPQACEEELVSYYDGEYRKEYSNKDFYDQEQMKAFFNRSLPEAQSRVDRIRSYLRSEDSIVELGCASGYFLSVIRPWVQSACGTEWDRANAAYAQSLGFDVRVNIEDFSRSFDKVFMFHVLEHVKNPIEFLRYLKKYIQPGGMLFIEVPSCDDVLLTTYAIQEFKDFYYQSAHLWYFNEQSLSYALNEAGFKVKILPVQRYDISNHIHWLKNRVPGGQGLYANLFSDECNHEYVKGLVAAKKTDTIFAICTVD